MRIEEDYIEEESKKMGLTAEVKAGGSIFVKTLFGGHWVINQCRRGWRLQHENYRIAGAARRGTYHKHTTVFEDELQALRYIYCHDKKIPMLPLVGAQLS